ncbi:MAG: nucleoside hydrolase [Bryobacteraceae bacterium]|nr:nucleoside hydrolase [Bryobacteraceae bacterium]
MNRFLLVTLIATTAWGAERPTAPWPPPQTIRAIIDTDIATEIDDQYAMAAALGFPDRIKLEGFVGAHFGDQGGASAIGRSVDELHNMLRLARMTGKFPVKAGAHPFQYRNLIPSSEGVDFIVEKARASTPEDPLWLIALGPATNAAAALLKDPTIAGKMVVMWHGRTQWPLRAWNFNAYNDILAARLLFELPCRLILFDTGTFLRIPMEETERRYSKLGPVGNYLHERRKISKGFMVPTKGFFDLGDIVAVLDPSAVQWERVIAPGVDQGLNYNFARKNGEIVRIYHVDTKRSFDVLEEALKRLPQ